MIGRSIDLRFEYPKTFCIFELIRSTYCTSPSMDSGRSMSLSLQYSVGLVVSVLWRIPSVLFVHYIKNKQGYDERSIQSKSG